MGAQYFLGRQLLDQSRQPAYWNGHDPPNIAYLCPACGEIWARVINTARRAFWVAKSRECQLHGVGSFIDSYRTEFGELPPEVLKYELEIRLNKFEKEMKDADS